MVMQEGRGVDVQFTADGHNGRTGIVDLDLDVQVRFLRGHLFGFLAEGTVRGLLVTACSPRRLPVTVGGSTREEAQPALAG
ncbi:hypothetical protein GCM10010446_21490 [Streptomyces enissocaesilis]|uniref:Uncharacterized protein n=1 Tax=Streptomyces enissocaesilis TaxID=332589 RepID=A0ABP6JPD3_9ACTN